VEGGEVGIRTGSCWGEWLEYLGGLDWCGRGDGGTGGGGRGTELTFLSRLGRTG